MIYVKNISKEMRDKYDQILKMSKSEMPIAHACKKVGITSQYFYQLRKRITAENFASANTKAVTNE